MRYHFIYLWLTSLVIIQNISCYQRNFLRTLKSVQLISNKQLDINILYTSVSKSEVEKISENKVKSFVQDVMRPYAMKLHTREQAPKEGQQEAPKTTMNYQPTRLDYLCFLTDSLLVYETLDEIVNNNEDLHILRNTGLERTEALKKDIEWITKSFDPSLSPPKPGEYGIKYSNFLKNLVLQSKPRFLCHYYNQYFAHTAGGIMIGKRMCDLLLNGNTLEFYKWKDVNGNTVTSKEGVKELLENTRIKIDTIAATWNEKEQQECLEETIACFQYGGSLMTYFKPH